jgi:hypothetical protein
MILRLLKGRGMVSGIFEKKQDAILPHFKHCLHGYDTLEIHRIRVFQNKVLRRF